MSGYRVTYWSLGSLPGGHTLEENRSSLSEQPHLAQNSIARGGASDQSFLSLLVFLSDLSWHRSCAFCSNSLSLHTQLPWCVWKTLLCCNCPLSLTLEVFMVPLLWWSPNLWKREYHVGFHLGLSTSESLVLGKLISCTSLFINCHILNEASLMRV